MNDYRREQDMRDAVEDARKEALHQAYDDQDPEDIRREIENTRADLSETVNAIQQKLNPQRLRDEAVSTVREATVGRVESMADDAKWKVKGAGDTVLETIKRNPIPAALVAVGLGWLMMETRSTAQSGRHDGDYQGRYEGRGRYYEGRRYEGERYTGTGYQGGRYRGERYYEAGQGYPVQGTYYGYGEYEGQQEQGRLHEVAQGAREAADNVKEKAGQVAEQARSRVEDLTDRTREQAGQIADEAQWRAQQLADEAQWRAQQVGSRFSDMVEEKPLLVAAGALALGAAIGLALPSTEKESEIFGDTRDRLMEKAQETASETMQKVQHVAEEAGQAAKETAKSEAKKEGLTGQK